MSLNNFFKTYNVLCGTAKIFICTAVITVFALNTVYAQGTDEITPDATGENDVRVSSEDPSLDAGGGVQMETITIDNFENSDLWYGSMYIDDGTVRVRKSQGAPVSVREANPDEALYVLGTKINFFKRSFSRAAVSPPRPMRIPGITKSISVWVNGKNRNHTLYALVRDMRGRPFRIRLGKMNFSGWSKLTGRVPDFVEQDDPDYATPYRRRGLEFMALLVQFDPLTSVGVFFTYFDNLEVETNMYHETLELEQAKLKAADRNEPLDNW